MPIETVMGIDTDGIKKKAEDDSSHIHSIYQPVLRQYAFDPGHPFSLLLNADQYRKHPQGR